MFFNRALGGSVARSGGGLLRVKILLRIERSHAACASRCDCLSVYLVCDVSGSKYAGRTGGGCVAGEAGPYRDIAILHLKLAVEQFGIRAMPDRDKNAG